MPGFRKGTKVYFKVNKFHKGLRKGVVTQVIKLPSGIKEYRIKTTEERSPSQIFIRQAKFVRRRK